MVGKSDIVPVIVTGLKEPSGGVTLMGIGNVFVVENRLNSKVMWSLAPVSMIQGPCAVFNMAQPIKE